MLSLDDPSFFPDVFKRVCEKQKKGAHSDLQQLFLEEHLEMSEALDQTLLQESWSWRNVHEAKALTLKLFQSDGALSLPTLYEAIEALRPLVYSLGPERHQDDARRLHLLHILEKLHDQKELRYELQRIGKPLQHPVLDRLIRATLDLPLKMPITELHARSAVLSALLTTLRQNVGSCFATAPAILIQQEQPLQFLRDMGQLLNTGRLKRVIGGEEYAVPLSPSWGMGDLKRPLLVADFTSGFAKRVARAPGLIAALQAAGMTESQNYEALIAQAFPNIEEEQPFRQITPAEILRVLLARSCELTEEELREFEGHVPQNAHQYVHQPFFEGHLYHLLHSTGGKRGNFVRFSQAYTQALNAFKAITDNALLKAWEFTIASFAEAKADFAQWNLYSSLGFDSQKPHGLGELFYAILQGEVEKIQQEQEEYRSRHDHLVAHMHSLEGRARHASKEEEVRWVQSEYQMRKHEMHRILAENDQATQRGQQIQKLASFLPEFYGACFKKYFQEIYDAEMHDVTSSPYDDSPAGFRLVYKHGRTNTALWTVIQNGPEFVESLAAFFRATEIELMHHSAAQSLESLVERLVSEAMLLVRRPEFLEQSFYRLASAYGEPLKQNPLENLSSIARKPWSYISGGTMTTLVSCYFTLPEAPREASRWVESEVELLSFLLESLRELPLSVEKEFEMRSEKSLLAFSPTHAFLVKPGWADLLKGWKSNVYTYTWIKEQWITPAQDFYSSTLLETRMLELLTEKLAQRLPLSHRGLFLEGVGNFSLSLTPSEYREHLMRALSYVRWMRDLRWLQQEIDSCLYEHLPLFPEFQLKERLERLFSAMEEVSSSLYQKIFKHFARFEEGLRRYWLFTSQDLRHIAKALLMLALKETKSQAPLHQKMVQAMQREGLSAPAPLLFADTNWVKNVFGFVVNPGSEELELWRFDPSGCHGRPMLSWKRWVDGSERKAWGLFTRVHQYQT